MDLIKTLPYACKDGRLVDFCVLSSAKPQIARKLEDQTRKKNDVRKRVY